LYAEGDVESKETHAIQIGCFSTMTMRSPLSFSPGMTMISHNFVYIAKGERRSTFKIAKMISPGAGLFKYARMLLRFCMA
jgi:hypothetical protein